MGWCLPVTANVALVRASKQTREPWLCPARSCRDPITCPTALGKPRVSPGLSLPALSAETGFAVTAISRTPGVTYSDSFDLQCIIKPHYPGRVPVSVTWRFQPVGTVEFQDLVTFTRDGGVQWGDRSSSFRTRTAIEKAESSSNVRLSISRASDTEAGKYQCAAELWRRNYNSSWTRLAERASNLLEIRVLQPGRPLGARVLALGGGGGGGIRGEGRKARAEPRAWPCSFPSLLR